MHPFQIPAGNELEARRLQFNLPPPVAAKLSVEDKEQVEAEAYRHALDTAWNAFFRGVESMQPRYVQLVADELHLNHGVSDAELARRHGLSSAAVGKILKRVRGFFNLPPRVAGNAKGGRARQKMRREQEAQK
jgi:hypothetical protein